jgi:hypothetical protein
MAAVLFVWYAATASVLGLCGVYGLVRYVVTRSARELAVRAVLGASPGVLVRLSVLRGQSPLSRWEQ